MFRESLQFVSDILTGQPPRWLFLCGRSGCGKTHLAKRIAAFLQKWGEWAYNKHYRAVQDPAKSDPDLVYSYGQEGPLFIKWAAIIDSARDGDYQPYQRASRDYFKVIDDVGAEGFGQDRKPTVFVTNQLGKLCDARLGKWTVWTSNFGLTDFAETFDARISSRMLRGENIICETIARDYNVRCNA